MADKTAIEWTRGDDGTAGSTWNPVMALLLDEQGNYVIDPKTNKPQRGWFCVHVSDGCKNCYADTRNQNTFFGNGLDYIAQNRRRVSIELSMTGQSGIDWPIRAKQPRRIFVCSMTDLFGDWMTDRMICAVFAAMSAAPQHTFIVLTKRAERMAYWFEQFGKRLSTSLLLGAIDLEIKEPAKSSFKHVSTMWPLPNVWLGVSAEDQKTADERIPHLLNCPAKVRWVSYEPALGPVDFGEFLDCGYESGGPQGWVSQNSLDWIVVGGESGKGARPFNVDWARRTIEAGAEADVPVFVKQLGADPRVDKVDAFDFGPTAFRNVSCDDKGYFAVLNDKKGGNISEWPEDLRVRQYPNPPAARRVA